MREEVEKALDCLGGGFDVNRDFRLRHCKGKERLLELSSAKTDLLVPGFGAFPGVSVDVKCDKGEIVRFRSEALDFIQMSTLMNKRCAIDGKIPSGLFQSTFGFTSGSWVQNASKTRCLAFDGYFFSLFEIRIDRRPLSASDRVAQAVPSTWDPAALARFIDKYGTHVIVGLRVGGQEVVSMRQDRSSLLQPLELKEHLHRLGDQIFSGSCTIALLGHKNANMQNKLDQVGEAFNLFDQPPIFMGDGFARMSSKQGVTVMWSKRGGEAAAGGHLEWLSTISSSPEAVNFTFLPIASVLADVPGKGFLSHAINLYLRYKPPMADLERFLDLQSHKIWAPLLQDLPLGPSANRSPATSSLQFGIFGPKLLVNTTQVIVGSSPVTGMRLHLEGRRNNRLAIHLQHPTTTPKSLRRLLTSPARWIDSAASAVSAAAVPIRSRRYSHVCTAAIECNPSGAASIVTGAQLHVARRVLCLRLLFSAVPGQVVEQSAWEEGSSSSSGSSRRLGSGLLSTLGATFSSSLEREAPAAVVEEDSGVFAGKPPVPVRRQRLLGLVDTGEVSRGPNCSPGHWLVTGGRLVVDKAGRVAVNVKFSLLAPSSTIDEGAL